MAYVINVESRADGRLAPPERRTVHTSRMTIGRGAECSVRLDDAKKHVSRVHAVVDLQGEGHVLTVMSTVNPVLLNGAKIGPGESAPIRAEDMIEIGDFSVQLVELHAAKATPGASSARALAASPFDFGLAGGGDTVPGEDPFKGLDDLLPAKPRPAAAPEPMLDPLAFAPGKPAARPSEGLVDGLGAASHLDLGQPNESTDPLMGLLSSSPGLSPGFDRPTFNPQPLASSAASLDQILGRGPTKPIGQPLADLSQHHVGGSSNIDHVQPINMAYRPQPIATPAAPLGSPDPFDGFDPFGSLIHPKSPPLARVEPEPAPEAAPAPVRVEPALAPAGVGPALAPAGKPTDTASPLASGAALVAFLEGAGLAHLEVSEADAEAFLRESGTIVRASVEGLIGLLLARSELKKEMRAEDRTMVASRDNNPIKLMTDPQEAMGYLFDKRERLSGAFLPPVQAVHDACDDLRVHEIALMAGMRAAFQGALKRFEPQLIEREADKQKGAFSLNKKVKLWDAFVAHHEKLSRDAEDDLLKVFGREFLGTYMAQVRRLRSGPRK